MKILRAQTVIPDSLYVKRAADRQLQSIIEDMGRPGYVLVARQMGKTNLLLHAKRAFSTPNDIFAYLDVSNFYPDPRSFFRNIIDVAVEAHETSESLATAISELRNGRELLPHKEHETELRLLLRKIPGKVVIFLDEIDALTKTAYSDQIFSLIRSTYFAGRANFSEFERLTYVLSGVAEPSEIIKNKDVSPFNIGEKIYLDDFSHKETLEFFELAQLKLEQHVKERIFHWTSGNPRMTWDLCSAVEDLARTSTEVLSEIDIDKLVKYLYLTRFDLPPVDHIRTLAEEDSEVRSALMTMHYSKSSAISDALRNRLYLAGICSLNTENRSMTIKNRIIAEALSEEWLMQVDRNKLSLEQAAKIYFERKNYIAAIDSYKEYLSQTTKKVLGEWPNYYIGVSYYYLRDYPNAIKYFASAPLKRSLHGSAYFVSKRMAGMSHFFLAQYENAAKLFEDALSGIDKTELPYEYYEVLSSLTSALYKSDRIDAQTAGSQYQQIIEDAVVISVGSQEQPWGELIATLRTNLAAVFRHLGDLNLAIEQLNIAANICDPAKSIGRILLLANLVDYNFEKHSLFKRAVSCVLENKLELHGVTDEVGPLTVDAFGNLILGLLKLEDYKLALTFAEEVIGRELSGTSSVNIGEAAEIALSRFMEFSTGDFARTLLETILATNTDKIRHDIRRRLLSLRIVMGDDILGTYEADYLSYFSAYGFVQSDYDYGALYVLIVRHLGKGRVEKVNAILELTDTFSPTVFSPAGAVVVEYLRTLTAIRTLSPKSSLPVVKSFLETTKFINKIELPYFGDDIVNQFKQSVSQTWRAQSQPIVNQFHRNEAKIGRNATVTVRYNDGRLDQGKFKKFEDDLKNKLCIILKPE
jgi:tetratricopeptide (TPR) repeat protein